MRGCWPPQMMRKSCSLLWICQLSPIHAASNVEEFGGEDEERSRAGGRWPGRSWARTRAHKRAWRRPALSETLTAAAIATAIVVSVLHALATAGKIRGARAAVDGGRRLRKKLPFCLDRLDGASQLSLFASTREAVPTGLLSPCTLRGLKGTCSRQLYAAWPGFTSLCPLRPTSGTGASIFMTQTSYGRRAPCQVLTSSLLDRGGASLLRPADTGRRPSHVVSWSRNGLPVFWTTACRLTSVYKPGICAERGKVASFHRTPPLRRLPRSVSMAPYPRLFRYTAVLLRPRATIACPPQRWHHLRLPTCLFCLIGDFSRFIYERLQLRACLCSIPFRAQSAYPSSLSSNVAAATQRYAPPWVLSNGHY